MLYATIFGFTGGHHIHRLQAFGGCAPHGWKRLRAAAHSTNSVYTWDEVADVAVSGVSLNAIGVVRVCRVFNVPMKLTLIVLAW